jgi:isoquinoline 1-oxidoreductase
MTSRESEISRIGADPEEQIPTVPFDFAMDRRRFTQLLGAGLVVTVLADVADAQRRGGRGGERRGVISARIHIGTNGRITVLTGKIEMGQGARAELTQAAAEELHVEPERIDAVMGDTSLVPDDGLTAGSRTTPSTVPAVRAGAAAAREALVRLAGERWKVELGTLSVADGKVVHGPSLREVTFAELAEGDAMAKAFSQEVPPEIGLTDVKKWRVLATSYPRPNRRDLVTGAHKFPSDIVLPDMLRGEVLRPPAFGAKLTAIDMDAARSFADVVIVRDGDFVGVAAPTAFRAQQAIEALAKTAEWTRTAQPSSSEIFDYLRKKAEERTPANPFREEMQRGAHQLRQTYRTAYVQHAPLEPRAAVAQWQDGHLTVWTGTQNPFGYQNELARALRIPSESVRVVVPDFGSGFGGKHTAEAAIEAARLARAASRPVALRWTREEEFTWAYYRPAALIDIEASLDAEGRIATWYMVNIHSGGAAIQSPYRLPQADSRFVAADSPLRTGSYRALAATANNFARECFMDELAELAHADPLDFRLAHLEDPRLRAVLETAAAKFDWKRRMAEKRKDVGIGLACGTEKGSYVAACVEIELDHQRQRIQVRHVCEAFECGAILNPDNLLSQVQSCIVMGLGPALREAMVFENGAILNGSFAEYRVPRMADLPELDIHLLDRPGLASAGGGETPIIAVAPAIANAVFHAKGERRRELPVRFA